MSTKTIRVKGYDVKGYHVAPHTRKIGGTNPQHPSEIRKTEIRETIRRAKAQLPADTLRKLEKTERKAEDAQERKYTKITAEEQKARRKKNRAHNCDVD